MNYEDLLDTITRQRLTIYHQERRIEALEKELSQATQPTMTNDLVNQLFNQLQTSNELMALKAKCERLTEENERLTAENKRLTENLNTANLIIGDIMAENKRLTKGGQS